MANKVQVETLRPHEGPDGMKQRGDKYERLEAEASALAKRRILRIVTPATKPAPKRK